MSEERIVQLSDTIQGDSPHRHPIVITEAVLVAIGFKKEFDNILKINQYLLDNDSFHVIIDQQTNSSTWRMHIDDCDFDSIGLCEIHYLHQLQDAYLHMTGEKLPIGQLHATKE